MIFGIGWIAIKAGLAENGTCTIENNFFQKKLIDEYDPCICIRIDVKENIMSTTYTFLYLAPGCIYSIKGICYCPVVESGISEQTMHRCHLAITLNMWW